MKKVAIVILNFNGEKDTIECLQSINDLITRDFQLLTIVVDNGSKKKFSIFNFQFSIGKIKIIRSEKNLGYSGGNNLGIEYGLGQNADYILILNNDTIVDKNLIKDLLVCLEKDERTGIVAPKIYFAKSFEFHKDRYKKDELGKVLWYAGGVMDWQNVVGSHRGVDEVDRGQYEDQTETDFASGCCLFVKKEVFEKIGQLDERYFLYYEDSDFNQRAKKAGFKIKYCPKAILWHKNAGSAGGSGSNLQDYYITRNRLLFGLRYAPLKSKLSLLKESLKLLFSGRTWQKRGVIDFYFNQFGEGSFQ